MQSIRHSRLLSVLLCGCWLHAVLPLVPLAHAAQEDDVAPAAPAAPATVAARLDEARAHIRNGDYDGAIEVLRAVVDAAPEQPEDLQIAYLLLIEAYVFLGNAFRFKPQGREASTLNYDKAKGLIAECLGVKALRHTHPAPASEYPPEMIDLFAEVRGELFGSFRVVELDPPDAVVLFDGDTLRSLPDEEGLGDIDLAIGPHVVVVSAQGHQDLTDEIAISPNATLERAYHLTKKRSATWYASVATGAAGVVTALAFLLSSGSNPTETPPEPLPGPPAPPDY